MVEGSDLAEGSPDGKGGTDAGGGDNSPPHNKWEARPKVSISQNERLKRNVLEINLEVESSVSRIETDMVAKLFQRMGLKVGMGGDLEGYQIKRKKVMAWLVDGADLSKYCTDECFRIGPGMKTSLIKPMDRREVQVTIKGININTPDTLVFSYLSHFGRLHSYKVVYIREREGPMAGLMNGDRRYMVDFTTGRNMGTYHLLDGESVTVSYSGQRKTCGRCHADSRTCPGGGWARACEERGTSRVELREHMVKLWAELGFRPDNFELAVGDGEVTESEVENHAKSFTPPPRGLVREEAKQMFRGVTVKNLPQGFEMADLMAMLEDSGLPAGIKDIQVSLYKERKQKMEADIEGLTAEVSNKLIDTIHEKEFPTWERKLYCRGMSDVSQKHTSTTHNERLQDKVQEKNHPSSPTKAPVSSLQTIPGLNLETRLTKAQRKKAAKGEQSGKRKVVVVSTPGAQTVNEEISDEEVINEDEKKQDEDPKEKLKRAMADVSQKSSGINPKDIETLAAAGLARSDEKNIKKHKLSPQQDARLVRNRKN